MAVSNVELRVDARQAVNALRDVNTASGQASAATQQLTQAVNNSSAALTRTGRELHTAANGMRYFIDAAGRARKENGQFLTTTEAAAAGIERQSRAARNASTSVATFSGAIGKLAGSFAAIQAAKFVFAKTAEIETQTRSLQVLTGSVQQAKQIIEELQQLGAVTPFTSTELIDAAKRLQAFGVEGSRVVEVTRRLADASGATGAELQGIVTAYGQVVAKGRLQGEELLQFQERGIGLQQELQKMYGMTGDELQKALSKGQISAKAVEVALQRLTSTGGKYANGAIAQSDTLSGRLSTLQDGIDGLARGIGAALSPAIKAVLNEAIFAINTINSLVATGARARGFGLGQAQRKTILNQAQKEAEQLVNLRRIRDPFERNRQFQQVTAQRERDLIEAYGISTGQVKQTAKAPAMATSIPALLGGTAKGGGGSDKAAKAAEQSAKQIADAQSILRLSQLQFDIEGKILEARSQNNDTLVVTRTAQKELAGITNEIANIQANKELPDAAKKLQIAKLELKAKGVSRQLAFDLVNAEQEKTKNTIETLQKLQDEQALLQARLDGNEAEVILKQQIRDILKDTVGLDAKTVEDQLNKINSLKEQLSIQSQIKGVADGIANTIGQGMTSAFDALIQGSEDFGASLQRIASGVLIDIAKQLLQVFVIQQAINAIGGAIGGLFGGGKGGGGVASPGLVYAADGAVFSNKIAAFARGGIVNQPTLFQFANGGTTHTGLMGEAGPEAILPLKRGADGKLGVAGGGGGNVVNVVVNVDASGSNVQGNNSEANQLGRAVSAAVQAELIKQQRPGGLLSGTR